MFITSRVWKVPKWLISANQENQFILNTTERLEYTGLILQTRWQVLYSEHRSTGLTVTGRKLYGAKIVYTIPKDQLGKFYCSLSPYFNYSSFRFDLFIISEIIFVLHKLISIEYSSNMKKAINNGFILKNKHFQFGMYKHRNMVLYIKCDSIYQKHERKSRTLILEQRTSQKNVFSIQVYSVHCITGKCL